MAWTIKHNAEDVARALARDRAGMLRDVAMPLARFYNVQVAGRAVGKYMQVGSAARRKPGDTGPLRIQSGRLVRAVQGGLGPGGSREGRVEVDITPQAIRITKAVLTPYAKIQEEGGTVTVPQPPNAQAKRAKMRRFFWAMWYATKDERWKGLALSKKPTFDITIPARPYLTPAHNDVLPAVAREAERLLTKILNP